jgi:hypothetical protein
MLEKGRHVFYSSGASRDPYCLTCLNDSPDHRVCFASGAALEAFTAALRASEAAVVDWRTVANDRTVEIIRLMGEVESLTKANTKAQEAIHEAREAWHAAVQEVESLRARVESVKAERDDAKEHAGALVVKLGVERAAVESLRADYAALLAIAGRLKASEESLTKEREASSAVTDFIEATEIHKGVKPWTWDACRCALCIRIAFALKAARAEATKAVFALQAIGYSTDYDSNAAKVAREALAAIRAHRPASPTPPTSPWHTHDWRCDPDCMAPMTPPSEELRKCQGHPCDLCGGMKHYCPRACAHPAPSPEPPREEPR